MMWSERLEVKMLMSILDYGLKNKIAQSKPSCEVDAILVAKD